VHISLRSQDSGDGHTNAFLRSQRQSRAAIQGDVISARRAKRALDQPYEIIVLPRPKQLVPVYRMEMRYRALVAWDNQVGLDGP
jgi:hypothetical protein